MRGPADLEGLRGFWQGGRLSLHSQAILMQSRLFHCNVLFQETADTDFLG